jgi:hypothetical protein
MSNKLKIIWRWHNNGHVTYMNFYVEHHALPVAHMFFTMGPYNYELYMNVKGRTGQPCVRLNSEEEAIAWLQDELKGVLLAFAPRRIYWREFIDETVNSWEHGNENLLWSRNKIERCLA